jgi:hypothetical protein
MVDKDKQRLDKLEGLVTGNGNKGFGIIDRLVTIEQALKNFAVLISDNLTKVKDEVHRGVSDSRIQNLEDDQLLNHSEMEEIVATAFEKLGKSRVDTTWKVVALVSPLITSLIVFLILHFVGGTL